MFLLLPPPLLLLLLLRPSLSAFFPGRIMYGENEYPELSGRMRLRAAVARCEVEQQCAGFTFMGTTDLDAERNVAFFRWALDSLCLTLQLSLQFSTLSVVVDAAGAIIPLLRFCFCCGCCCFCCC